jgi:diguanylate cyclase (GGDEF)-like protein
MKRETGGGTRARQRVLLGAGVAGAAMAALALAGALGAIGSGIAAAGIGAFLLLAGASAACVRYRRAARISDEDLASAQALLVFLVLGWLSFHATAILPAVTLLYALTALYCAIELDPSRFAPLAAIALATHGAALLASAGSVAAAWVQLATLACVLGGFGYGAAIVRRLRERLMQARRDLYTAGADARDQAGRDALTGTLHRRQLFEALEREMARAERTGKPLSVARVDLDGLRAINDAHGQAAGDIALKRFAAAAAEALRDVDLVGRYGGKEFLIVMPDTDLKGAVIAAGRVRAAVAREPAPDPAERRGLSCTLGVAEHHRGENTRLLLGRAESGLSYAKAAGRDRVVALDDGGKPLLVAA